MNKTTLIAQQCAMIMILTNSPALAKCLTYREAKKEYNGAYLTWKHENGQRCWGVKPRHSPRPTAKAETEPDEGNIATPVPYVVQFLHEQAPPPPADCVPEVVLVREPEPGGTDIEQASIWPVMEEQPPNVYRVLAIVISCLLSFGFGGLAATHIKMR